MTLGEPSICPGTLGHLMHATPQRVCPHCATIGYTADRRCPFCRRPYRRRTLAAVAAMLLVSVLVLLGAFFAMLVVAGNTLESELDRQVRTVQEDFDESVTGLRRDVRRELDRRLPAVPTTTPTPTP
jgi:hypothetical protein